MKYFWFGHEDILVKQPEDNDWQILTENGVEDKEDNSYEDIWTPVRKIENENSKFWFDKFSERVGLSEDKDIQIITAELLDEMLQVAKAKESIFFMPPNQMAYIEEILNSMKNKPLAVMPEICLLNPEAEELIQNPRQRIDENYYLNDWNKPNKVISRTTEDRPKTIQDNIPAPVLMPAAALTSDKPEILGHYTTDKKLKFYETELELPHQAKQGSREPGLGLIWAWGWGKQLWQWALPYTAVNIIDDKNTFKLTQEGDGLQLKLSIQEEGKKTNVKFFDLRPPVIDWYLNPPEIDNADNDS